jgi:phosphate transport system substrate-binding protein
MFFLEKRTKTPQNAQKRNRFPLDEWRKSMKLALSLALAIWAMGAVEAMGKELKISAGVTPQQNIFKYVAKPFEKSTGIKIVFTNKDPKGQGGDAVFKEVDQGIAEAGAGGAVWDDWKQMMVEKGYAAKNLDKMNTRVIGRDRVKFLTYPGGPKALSEAQLKGILTGKIKNWKEAGGENLAITLVISEALPATVNFLENRFLDGQKLATSNVKKVSKEDGMSVMAKTISTTRGAFGFGPSDLPSDGVNVPQTPEVGRPLSMLWLGKPSPELLKFMDFIENEGPKLGVLQ